MNNEVSDQSIVLQLWELIPNKIDPGWATLIAGLTGFIIVTFQARTGFRSLIASQKAQAELDRKAQEHQAEIDRLARIDQANLGRQGEERRLQEEKETLAGALVGELSAISNVANNTKQAIMIIETGYEVMENQVPDSLPDFSLSYPWVETRVFDALVERIGILGPSISSDVVELYAKIAIWKSPRNEATGKAFLPGENVLPAKAIAKIYEMQRNAINTWIDDCIHIQHRLLSVYGMHEDPGPLFFVKNKSESDNSEDQSHAAKVHSDP